VHINSHVTLVSIKGQLIPQEKPTIQKNQNPDFFFFSYAFSSMNKTNQKQNSIDFVQQPKKEKEEREREEKLTFKTLIYLLFLSFLSNKTHNKHNLNKIN
jgi:hypothetical protein